MFSFINSSSICSGRVSPSLIPAFASSMVLIFWEGIERGICNRANRFGGLLKERMYIMYRVWMARIPVMNGQYIG